MAASLVNARRRLAQKLRAYEQVVTGVQASPPSGTYAGIAAGSEARRRLISSDLASTERSTASPREAIDRYDGSYIYLPSIPEQRRVAANGYGPSYDSDDSTITTSVVTGEKLGFLVPDRNFSTTLAANLTAEIHTRLPVTDTDGLPGLHTLINRALRRLRIVKRLSLTGVTNAYRYDLSAYADWLQHPNQLGQVYLPDATDGLTRDPDPMPGNSRIRFDGATPYLLTEYPVVTAATFYADFYRPAHTWIKVAGTFADSTVGLVNETDQADLNLDTLVLVAYAFACKALARRDPQGLEASWALEAEDAARAAYPYLKWGEEQIPHQPKNTGWGTDNPRWLAGREGLASSGGSGGSWP